MDMVGITRHKDLGRGFIRQVLVNGNRLPGCLRSIEEKRSSDDDVWLLGWCCNDLRVGIRWAVSGHATGVLRARVHDLG